MEEILRKVKEAEQKAKAVVEEKRLTADQTVNEARVQASRLVEQSIRNARDEAERLKSERNAQASSKLVELRTGSDAQARQIADSAKTRLPEAISLIKERIVTRDGSR